MTARRSTVIALIVAAVSALGLAGSLVLLPMYYDAAFSAKPIVVGPDEPVEFGGYTFTLTASAAFPGEGLDENQVPVGEALVAAIIEIEPGPGIGADDIDTCDAELLERSSDRTWDTLSSEREFGYGIADDSSTNCLLDDEALQYEVVFLTPDGVYDDAVVDITLASDFDRFLRFELAP